jgi:hypothetical protein
MNLCYSNCVGVQLFTQNRDIFSVRFWRAFLEYCQAMAEVEWYPRRVLPRRCIYGSRQSGALEMFRRVGYPNSSVRATRQAIRSGILFIWAVVVSQNRARVRNRRAFGSGRKKPLSTKKQVLDILPF